MASLVEKDGRSKKRREPSFLDDRGPRWCSKSKSMRSAPPKRIGKKKLRQFQHQFHRSYRAMAASMEPAVQIMCKNERECYKTEIRRCVKSALSSWNEKSSSEQGPEYELVEQLGGFQYPHFMLFHCNFTARPKNANEAENKLFFAELKEVPSLEKVGEYDLRCQFCCILGPSGCETGLSYCTFCELHPRGRGRGRGRLGVHHPEAGFTEADFNKIRLADLEGLDG